MARKNRYLFRGRISERKFRDLLRLFALDITADRAALLTGLSHNTTARLYTLLRRRIAELAEADCPFQGQVEIDESYFGPTRQRGRPGLGRGRGVAGKVPVFGILERGGRVHCQIVPGLGRGRGVAGKVPVFGILERGGRVHCQIVKNCSKTTLQAIIEGRVHLSAEISSDGFRSYDGLVEAGFRRHHRINKYWQRDRAIFSENGVHINGIESFWSYAKRRHAKFNGLRKTSFPVVLKETEFRFNNRENDLYKILLRSCRMKPLRR